jgi:hypothetical protein
MPRQGTMIPPGAKDKPLYEAALKYDKAAEKLKRAKSLRDEARDAVIAIMNRSRRKTYQHADVTVEIVAHDSLKVQVGEETDQE